MRGGLALLVGLLAVAACAGSPTDAATPPSPPPTIADATSVPSTSTSTSSTTSASTTEVSSSSDDGSSTTPRPAWLGTRVLPVRADGFAEARPTPPELVDRRFATIDTLPPPESSVFALEVGPVPDDVVARSTWTSACPVALGDLRYVTLPFWGFDGRLHTGELLVNERAIDAVGQGFGRLFERRFPIEEMRITTLADLDAPPTGDGNGTSAFVCRPARGSTSWSRHAYGLAIDINPFQNPSVKGDRVLPELATAFADRDDPRAGMLTGDDVGGFRAAGWGWGGLWRSQKDHMHVSSNGR